MAALVAASTSAGDLPRAISERSALLVMAIISAGPTLWPETSAMSRPTLPSATKKS